MAVIRKAKIAVVDDDDSFRAATEWLLKAHGFAVSSFGSARSYLDLHQEANIDCIISDISMPGMSGIELKQHLNGLGSSIPLIFVSAQTDATLSDRVASCGAHALLQKPFHGNDLIKAIQQAIREN